jgi:hypothetical protein
MKSTQTPVAGRTGRNCSRQDGIRGGAVTGPWRSVGAAAGPARPKPEPTAVRGPIAATPGDAVAQDVPDGPDAPGVPVAAPAPHPVAPTPLPATVAARAREPARPARPDSQRTVWIWTLFGLAVAGGLIALAVLFRPEAPAPRATPADAVAPAPAAPVATAANAPAGTPLPAAVRIIVRVAPDTGRGHQDTIVAALRSAGYDSVEVNVMPFPILRSRVGYFHESDRPAAVALVAALAQITGDAVELRDYGPLEIMAAPGRLDLWIGG